MKDVKYSKSPREENRYSLSSFLSKEGLALLDGSEKKALVDLLEAGNGIKYCGLSGGKVDSLSFRWIEKVSESFYFPQLKKLTIWGGDLTKINWNFLPKHIKLKYFLIRNCILSEFPEFGNLLELEDVGVENSKVSKISGLDGLANLKRLSLNGNEIESLEGLSSLKNLKELYVEGNRIRNLNGLKDLNGLFTLKDLALDNNKIEDLDIDCEIPSLEVITLVNNTISHITAVKNLPSLKTLDLCSNKLERIENLSNLPSLEAVFVDGNPIKSFSGLEDLPSTAYVNEMKRSNFSDLEIEQLEKYLDSIGWEYDWQEYDSFEGREIYLIIGGPDS